MRDIKASADRALELAGFDVVKESKPTFEVNALKADIFDKPISVNSENITRQLDREFVAWAKSKPTK